MSEEDKKDPFDGYNFAIRTFWFDAADLQIFRGWGRDIYSDGERTSIKNRIRGTGFSEKDDVKIIGTNIRTKEFSFSVSTDENATENWKSTASNIIDDYSELVDKKSRRFEIIKKRCGEKTPTAHLGYTEKDWEIGNKTEWWIETLVPNFVIAQLEQDILLGRVDKIHFGIEWIAGLVLDEHAPPAARNTWGLVQEKENRPEMLNGYVTSIGWNLIASNQKPAGDSEVEEEIGPAAVDPVLKNIAGISQAIIALANQTKAAFVFAVVLIVIAHFLR